MKTTRVLFLAACGWAFIGSALPAQEQVNKDASVPLPMGKLAFVTSAGFGRAGNIFIMTGNVRVMTLAHQTRDPEFVAEGRQIIYSANDPNAFGIYLYDLAQQTNTQLLPNTNDVRGPALSPDGKRIAFYQSEEMSSQIMVADVDGTNLKQLTEGPYFNWTPRWSPDGRQLLFETTRNETPATSGGGGQRDIYVMDADGKNQTNLTPKSYGHNASWSPDGKHIAYMKYGAIFTMKSDGSEKKNISRSKVRDSEPAWSPDGQWIAFTRTPENSNAMDLWIMKSDGSEQRPVTFNEGSTSSFSPSWSKE